MECGRLQSQYISEARGSAHFSQVKLCIQSLPYNHFVRNPVYQTTDAIRGRGSSGEVDNPAGYRYIIVIYSYCLSRYLCCTGILLYHIFTQVSSLYYVPTFPSRYLMLRLGLLISCLGLACTFGLSLGPLLPVVLILW